MKRRQFLQLSAAAAGSFAINDSLRKLNAATPGDRAKLQDESYGPLKPVAEEISGLPLLNLPEGFSYIAFGWAGQELSDGCLTPAFHDGMGVVTTEGSDITLIRNHEVAGRQLSFSNTGHTYDKMAGGGCVTMVFDGGSGTYKSGHAAISGTVNNCAGGVTPWGTWLTCEETVEGTLESRDASTYPKDHGWIFEVPPDGSASAIPLKAMGRFVHEAVAIDPQSGIVYETEDRRLSGFYRFVPKVPGKLAAGGTLEMMRVPGKTNLSCGTGGATLFENIEWVPIHDPEMAHTPGTEDTVGVFRQGVEQGGTAFSRLEGCWYGNGLVYFVATCGGDAGKGQIWAYDPDENTLQVVFESPGSEVLNFPDNIAVSPRGGMILCEDCDMTKTLKKGRVEQLFPRMHGLTAEGKIFTLAMNNFVLEKSHQGFCGDFRGREWAGATFSPDGKWLFVNLQNPGVTLAITGPWEKGGI